jgi:hypothetical protein
MSNKYLFVHDTFILNYFITFIQMRCYACVFCYTLYTLLYDMILRMHILYYSPIHDTVCILMHIYFGELLSLSFSWAAEAYLYISLIVVYTQQYNTTNVLTTTSSGNRLRAPRL